MAFSKFAQGQLSDTISTVFTASATTNILGIKLHNNHTSNSSVQIHSVTSGGTADDTNQFESIDIPSSSSIYISEIDVLSNGDFIAMVADNASVVNYKIIGEVQ